MGDAYAHATAKDIAKAREAEAPPIVAQSRGNQVELEQVTGLDPDTDPALLIEAFQAESSCFLTFHQLDLLDQISEAGAEALAEELAALEKDSEERQDALEETRPASSGRFQGINTSEQQRQRGGSAAGPVQVPEAGTPDGSEGLETRSSGYDKKVTLTFDDGPDVINGTTEDILDVLRYYREERGVEIRATFFVAAERIVAPEKYGLDADEADEAHRLLARMRDEGHIVANHGYEHKLDVGDNGDAFPAHQTSTTDADLTESIIDEYQDPFTPSYFRFPGGTADAESLQNLEDRGLASVGWNLNSADYNYDYLDTEQAQTDWGTDAFTQDGEHRYLPPDDLSEHRSPEGSEAYNAESDYLADLTAQRDDEDNQGGIVLMHDAFREYPTNDADVEEAKEVAERQGVTEEVTDGMTSEQDWYDEQGLLNEEGHLEHPHRYADEGVSDEEEASERAEMRKAFAETRGRGFTARMLAAFIEDCIANEYTFVGLDDQEAFPTTNAYARACDPLPFVRREIFDEMLNIQQFAIAHRDEVGPDLIPDLLDSLNAVIDYPLAWENVDDFAEVTEAYLDTPLGCSL